MQPPTVREVTKRLEAEGWELVRVRGDHRQFSKDGHTVTIPGSLGKHLARGTYASICKSVGW